MGKEGGAKHDQGPLSQTIRDLEGRNSREFGRRLFAVFRSGRKETLVFPTPFEGENGLSEFLIITDEGCKGIEVRKQDKNFADLETIQNLIMARLGKKPGLFSPAGYARDDQGEMLVIGGKFVITPKRAEKFIRSFEADRWMHNDTCRLVDIDDDTVQKIIQLNQDRANKARETSQAIESALKAD